MVVVAPASRVMRQVAEPQSFHDLISKPEILVPLLHVAMTKEVKKIKEVSNVLEVLGTEYT